LQNNINFWQFLYKNGYLPVIAAWLVTLSFIIDNYWADNASVSSVQNKLQQYINQQQNDIAIVANDTALLNKLYQKQYNATTLQEFTQKKYFLFTYTSTNALPQLTFWNTQTVLPSDSIIRNTDSVGFATLQNGYYIWCKKNTTAGFLIALIPIKWNYVITNDYLINTFAISEGLEKNYDIALDGGKGSIMSKQGTHLFYLYKKAGSVVAKNTVASAVLRIVGTVLLLLFIHMCAVYMAQRKRLWKVVALLSIIVAGLRIASYYLIIPLNFRQFELFDPSIYGSNMVLRSLGDLLINAILFVWVVLFVRHQLLVKKYEVALKFRSLKWVWLLLAAVTLLVATYMCGHILRTMVADSQISFDVINFFTLNKYSIIGFIVLCCIAIGYFLTGQIIVYLLKPLFAQNLMPLYILVTVIGLSLLTISFNVTLVAFELYLLIWLILFLLLLSQRQLSFQTTRISSSKLIFWLFFFSLSITAVVIKENTTKEKANRQHYAETLSTKADPSSETLMSTLLTDFRNEVLATNFSKFKTINTSQQFKDSLVGSNFLGYTNKYDTDVYAYDANERPLVNEDNTSFNELNTVLTTQGRPADIPDLYIYDIAYDKYSYISKKTVTDTSGKTLGYVFILARSKKFKSDAPYPELFSRGNQNAIENSSIYAFAVYNDLQLVDNHNDYAFATRITKEQVPKDEFAVKEKNSFDELWYRAGPESVVIIAKKSNFLLETITLFSYLFCAFLIVTGIFWLLNIFVRSRLNTIKLRTYLQLNIRNQIHGTIIFISILSFLVIGIATILFFIRRYENNNRERLSKTIKVMEREVRNSFADLTVFDDEIEIYDDGYKEKLQQTIKKISEIHDADINLYDLEGNLKTSSLPLPYNRGIVSTKMDPEAYYHINKQKEVQYFKEEHIGKLNFISNYVPVIDKKGREYAYLNIPYFTSQSKLKQEIANFLVTIINLNAFIFLIAGIVALFITNRITRSFSFISQKMKEVSLGGTNAAINWKRNDEIGELVNEYNKMVGKLDASASALAKSEREGAWREMARQVAHEIKNPLTPMKLSLQYLQKAISNNADNVRELTANVAQTLVEQINHLNQIAGEFSQFANIGNARTEVFDLHEVLYQLIQLHRMDDGVQLDCSPVHQKVMIEADRTHINRLFTNLIQNAIQAVPEGKEAHILVHEELHSDKILIKITDNGTGISDNLRSQIFTPNFTTKTSGTGLGLAMCKSIVEQVKGNIWFTTTLGTGTTFFVELPLSMQEHA
jgi:two-component system, NtrC family, nitrogen regulation sensor histidine kinase NtrY